VSSIFAKSTAAAALLALTAPAGAQGQDLAKPDSAFADSVPKRNWSGVVERTSRGHLVGNPDAEVKLIEFVSYTCPHCADFARQGEPAIDLSLLVPGDMSLEVRSVIRNELDLTVSLLVACGDPAGFKERHRDFMWSQRVWLDKFSNAPKTQQAIWLRGDVNGRLNAASALDFDDKLIARGFSPTQITACLSDTAATKALIAHSNADYAEFGVPGTPSFALDGKLLKDVHHWGALYPVLAEKFKPVPASQDSAFGGQ
jgi:protein-disulfide isomerase